MEFVPRNLLIVGAGFSVNAGLPLASDFTSKLLDIADLNLDGPSAVQVKFLKEFVSQAFAEGRNIEAQQWPELEDIFTVIDLSANTGHHLGKNFSAADLRVVRRSLIVRMIRMLAQLYRDRQSNPDVGWRRLETLFSEFDTDTSSVLSMNWDTVFERGIARAQGIRSVEYGCGAKPTKFSGGGLVDRAIDDSRQLRLIKPHGSVNWLYCDACREIFWLPPSDNERVATALFRKRDWDTIARFTQSKSRPKIFSPHCPHCESNAIGTRFATFSYRKALEFPMHAGSWKAAELHLKAAAHWVFFGYSMPAADYEFKYLMKRVQLSESIRPSITVITGGTDAKNTIARFEKFFGRVSGSRTYFETGLTTAAVGHLRSIGLMTGL